MKSVEHFFSLQELKRRSREIYGGFYGVDGQYLHEQRTHLNIRTCSYALAALLRLEDRKKYLGYTA
jgi:hypothetical protein